MDWLNPTRLRPLNAVLALTDNYRLGGYRASPTEVQKLAYLLKSAGEPGLQKLIYRRASHGPYSYNLTAVLQALEPLNGHNTTSDYPFNWVSRLIEGFETPYGLEMLATLHWVAQEDPEAAQDCQVAIQRVQDWSDRKKNLFKPRHLAIAWEHLKTEGWFTPEPSVQRVGC